MSTTERRPVEVPEAPSHTGAVLLVCATAALGGFLFGYDTAVINGSVESSALIGAGVGLAFTYGLYTGFAALALLFVLRVIRETNGRELEDM